MCWFRQKNENDPLKILALIRPHQWIKNGFVFTGLLFSREWHNVSLVAQVVVSAIAFALVSSSVYIMNDIFDLESDRCHPKKRNRPLASGEVSLFVARGLASCLLAVGLFLGFLVSYAVCLLLLFYLLLNVAYSLHLKHVVILDVFCIAAGFMLRILVGTIGVGIPPSKWLLLCGLMITLFLGFAKRRAEVIAMMDDKNKTRKVLQSYGTVLLDEIIGICATCVIISYSLYTMSSDTAAIHHTEDLIYTVPFVAYALFRYIFLLHYCNGGDDPSKELFKDPHILLSVVGWSILTLFLLSH